MPESYENIKKLLCPNCFMKEIDVQLVFDDEEQVYYCQRCCFEGKQEDIEACYHAYTRFKYKDMAKPY